jgi:hypothetical protein
MNRSKGNPHILVEPCCGPGEAAVKYDHSDMLGLTIVCK